MTVSIIRKTTQGEKHVSFFIFKFTPLLLPYSIYNTKYGNKLLSIGQLNLVTHEADTLVTPYVIIISTCVADISLAVHES